MLTLKLSDDLQASLGLETAEQAEALLKDAADAKTKLSAATKRNGELASQVVAFENRLTQIETRISGIRSFDETQLRGFAKDEAGKEATRLQAEFMAKTGIKPLDTAPAGGGDKAKQEKFEDKVAAKIAEGKKKGEAIVACVNEFPELHKDFVNREGKI